MQFGKHTATVERTKGAQSPAAVFTRGLQVSGTQWKFSFPNGFGASVINDGYGGEQGLFEVAVLGPDGNLTYETPITDDVIGCLTALEVAETLDKIEALTGDSVAAEMKARADRERDRRIAELRAELAALEGGVSA